MKFSLNNLFEKNMDKTFWGVMSVVIEKSRRKANMVTPGDGKFGL